MKTGIFNSMLPQDITTATLYIVYTVYSHYLGENVFIMSTLSF